MKHVLEVINLVRDSLSSGLVSARLLQDENTGTQIRYRIGNNVEFFADVIKNEPSSVSIARRLMQGNLNFPDIPKEMQGTVYNKLTENLIRVQNSNIESGYGLDSKADSLAFDAEVQKLYSKEVTLYQSKINVTYVDFSDSLLERNMDPMIKLAVDAHTDTNALLRLNSLGEYEAVAKLRVPDLVDPIQTLKAISQANQEHCVNPLEEISRYAVVELLNGAESIKQINNSAVMQLDGRYYRSMWSEIDPVAGFVGVPAVEPKLEETRSTSLDGPSM